MNKTDTALETFTGGFNCAQAVFSSFSEDYGLPRELALKISGGLGGGVRCGEICGAVTGGALVIGTSCGQTEPGDLQSKEHCGKETAEFVRRFREKTGGCICRELLGIDISSPENRAKAKEAGRFITVCNPAIKTAVEILEEMGY